MHKFNAGINANLMFFFTFILVNKSFVQKLSDQS